MLVSFALFVVLCIVTIIINNFTLASKQCRFKVFIFYTVSSGMLNSTKPLRFLTKINGHMIPVLNAKNADICNRGWVRPSMETVDRQAVSFCQFYVSVLHGHSQISICAVLKPKFAWWKVLKVTDLLDGYVQWLNLLTGCAVATNSV